jgi:hypothetical protein
MVSVDSTINRAHQHAAGARRHPQAQVTPPVGEPADHALGRSRGGLSTKVHLACEQGRKTLAAALTPGQAADSPRFTTVLGRIRVSRRSGPGRPRTRPVEVLADKAYSSRANRAYLRRRGIPATIPVKADQQANRRKKGSAGGRPPAFDPTRYRRSATPSSAESTGTNSTAASPPATTSSPSATRPLSRSPTSTSAYQIGPSTPRRRPTGRVLATSDGGPGRDERLRPGLRHRGNGRSPPRRSAAWTSRTRRSAA